VTRRELLAVVVGLKTYRQYLLGRQFVISTDHSALQSLRRSPQPIGQQARWQAFIEQFSFVIVHRPVSRVMNRVKTKFVELSQLVPEHLKLQVVERKHQFRPGN